MALSPEVQKGIAKATYHMKQSCDFMLAGKMPIKKFVAYAFARIKEIRDLMSYVDSDGDISPGGLQNLHAPADNEAPEDFSWEE